MIETIITSLAWVGGLFIWILAGLLTVKLTEGDDFPIGFVVIMGCISLAALLIYEICNFIFQALAMPYRINEIANRDCDCNSQENGRKRTRTRRRRTRR